MCKHTHTLKHTDTHLDIESTLAHFGNCSVLWLALLFLMIQSFNGFFIDVSTFVRGDRVTLSCAQSRVYSLSVKIIRLLPQCLYLCCEHGGLKAKNRAGEVCVRKRALEFDKTLVLNLRKTPCCAVI